MYKLYVFCTQSYFVSLSQIFIFSNAYFCYAINVMHFLGNIRLKERVVNNLLSLKKTKNYAPGWARTTNLSVNSRTRCQLRHGGFLWSTSKTVTSDLNVLYIYILHSTRTRLFFTLPLPCTRTRILSLFQLPDLKRLSWSSIRFYVCTSTCTYVLLHLYIHFYMMI